MTKDNNGQWGCSVHEPRFHCAECNPYTVLFVEEYYAIRVPQHEVFMVTIPLIGKETDNGSNWQIPRSKPLESLD